jgi:hypothetical protein
MTETFSTPVFHLCRIEHNETSSWTDGKFRCPFALFGERETFTVLKT